jgi:hypothetical protein
MGFSGNFDVISTTPDSGCAARDRVCAGPFAQRASAAPWRSSLKSFQGGRRARAGIDHRGSKGFSMNNTAATLARPAKGREKDEGVRHIKSRVQFDLTPRAMALLTEFKEKTDAATYVIPAAVDSDSLLAREITFYQWYTCSRESRCQRRAWYYAAFKKRAGDRPEENKTGYDNLQRLDCGQAEGLENCPGPATFTCRL